MPKWVGLPELIVVLVIVLLIFGVGRISKIAGEMGEGIRAFKDGLTGEKKDEINSEEQDLSENNDQ
ncbi:MAG: twin-arginine translocase TatA/TatE family subunit [Brevefilum sp.]|nr:twin-arginine translocase TatA/TatE family subunit [Brevefilum sp.]MDW7755966.1 twin-arginine translocase TatA/TatE family subunit [Brevefilum sp.]